MKTNQMWKRGVAVAMLMILVGALIAGCATGGNVAEIPPVSPLVGTWTLTVDWWGKGGGADHILTVNPDLTGTLEFQMGNSADLADVMVDGDALTFTLVILKGGQEVALPFEGTISGDTITGAFNQGSNPATGVRN